MSATPSEHRRPSVERCFRCGGLAERPVTAMGPIGGRKEKRLPVCLDCLALLGQDHEAFWKPLRREGGTR